MKNDLIESTDVFPEKFNEKQRKQLLEERQNIIIENITTIEKSFFRIGKALAEIKHHRLYKADPIYNKWKDYVEHRIYPHLHQTTITDYIGIVRMQIENDDFIGEEELVNLGFKKARLLKSKYNLIQQIEDNTEREKMMERFKENYRKCQEEFQLIPFTTFRKVFDFIKSERQQNHIMEKNLGSMHLKFNRKTNTITIKSEYTEELEGLFYKLAGS